MKGKGYNSWNKNNVTREGWHFINKKDYQQCDLGFQEKQNNNDDEWGWGEFDKITKKLGETKKYKMTTITCERGDLSL